MSDLRDKLLKAGLVSEEQAKAAETQRQAEAQRQADAQRQRQGGRGDGRGGQGGRGPGDGRGGRGEGRGHGGQGGQGGQGQRRQERAEGPQAEGVKLSGEEVKRLVQLAQQGRVEPKTRGHRRWYYVTRKGLVPFLEVSDETAKDLESGALALCETPRGECWLVDQATAAKLVETDPSWVRGPSLIAG